MNDTNKQLPSESTDSGGARRRFVRGAAAALPIVLTVKSRSALATGTTCFAPSATASIALLHSRPGRDKLFCSGRTPGFWMNAWKTHEVIWKQSGGEGVLFSTVFGSGFPGMSLKQVMNLTGTADPFQLGAHLSAAYLNYKMGWVPSSGDNEVLSLQDLKDMWSGRNGSYTPTAGVTWGGEQIVTYLKTTMPL